jgi:hypothetical protein
LWENQIFVGLGLIFLASVGIYLVSINFLLAFVETFLPWSKVSCLAKKNDKLASLKKNSVLVCFVGPQNILTP